jgi:glycolate oxidase FAD binding subunit
MGGDELGDDAAFWTTVRDQTHPFFANAQARSGALSLNSTAAPLSLGPQAVEWSGSLRWIAADADAEQVHAAARAAGGHATLYRGGDRSRGIQRLAPAVLALHQRLKKALDPDGLFGPHRIHPAF